MSQPATTKIATAYNPDQVPGTRRLISICRDNTSAKANRDHGRFVASEIKNGACVWSTRRCTEQAAIDHAIALGYTDVVRES